MLAEKVPYNKAQTIKNELMQHGLIDLNYKPKKTEKYIYFPLIKSYKNTVNTELESVNKKNLEDELKTILNSKELEKLKLGRDVIGTIAILEVDPQLRHKEKEIAQTLLSFEKSVQTIVRKKTKHEGKYRIQSYEYLAGEKTYETGHIENGVKLNLNINNAYYSPRMATERKRINQLIKPSETILILGSGIGPYTCNIAKNTGAYSVIGVEHNPHASEYEKKNIIKNKLKNATAKCEDASMYLDNITEKVDRIIIPAPENSITFITKAATKINKNGWLHHYFFAKPEDLPSEKEKIKKKIQEKHKIEYISRCGSHAPGVYRYCADIKILN